LKDNVSVCLRYFVCFTNDGRSCWDNHRRGQAYRVGVKVEIATSGKVYPTETGQIRVSYSCFCKREGKCTITCTSGSISTVGLVSYDNSTRYDGSWKRRTGTLSTKEIGMAETNKKERGIGWGASCSPAVGHHGGHRAILVSLVPTILMDRESADTASRERMQAMRQRPHIHRTDEQTRGVRKRPAERMFDS